MVNIVVINTCNNKLAPEKARNDNVIEGHSTCVLEVYLLMAQLKGDDKTLEIEFENTMYFNR